MEKFKDILKSMRGVFLPKQENNPLTDDIFKSIEDLQYYGSEYDHINRHNDMKNIGNDMKKAMKDAHVKFKAHAL